MKPIPTMIALVLTASSAVAMPPAVPQGFIPNAARVQMVWEFEGNLSQVLGAPVHLTSVHSYEEQDGKSTMCVIGKVAGHRLRMFSGSSPTVVQPTQEQWVEAGCTRPGYLLLR